jgi:glycosyltransferase involved in cell wall biosynthesis
VLSVVLTVWNEETNLPRVLQSVSGLADEIVVVDTESTDNSVAIAKKFGCKVFHHEYSGIVEPVRNFSVSKAKGDWILLLDADEEVTPELAEFIKTAIENPGVDYYRIPRKNIIFSTWIKSEHWWPDYVYRLFKKGYVVWSAAIHSLPETRGVGQEFPAEEKYALIHHNYQTLSQYLERLDRYTDYQLRLILEKPIPFSWTLVITKPVSEFLNQYFARQGYKEGIHGLILAGLQSFSEFVLYAKYWQYLGSKPEDVSAGVFNLTVRRQLAEYQWWAYEQKISTASFWTRPYWKIARKVSVFLAKHS